MSPNPPDLTWIEKKALIIGRASPEPSKRHIETVCTGAITEDGQLLRLYPVSFRYLEENKKYKLWTWASFHVWKDPQDKRKESYRVREDSITILSNVESATEQLSLIKRAISPDRESLEEQYRKDWTSMGIVEIAYRDLKAELPKKRWDVDKPYIKQAHLMVDKKPLEQMPIVLKLSFSCKNNPNCKGHVSTLIAWEYIEAFRAFRDRYSSPLEAFHKLKDAIVKRYFAPPRAAYAIFGTHRRFPVWIIGQLYAFETNLPPRLF